MRKLTKMFNCNIVLLLLILLLVGCSGEVKDTKENPHKDNPASESTSTITKETEATEEIVKNDKKDVSQESKNDDSNSWNEEDTSTGIQQNQNSVPNKNNTSGKNDSKEESNNESVKKETNNKQNEPSGNKEESKESNTNGNKVTNEYHKNTNKKDKEKAISLVKNYLRDRNLLIEDKNHFVQYEGQKNKEILIGYSTLISGHISSNGHYAVDIESGKVKDIYNELDQYISPQ